MEVKEFSDIKLSKVKLIAGRSNMELSQLISEKVNIPLTKLVFRDFGNTEISVEIKENVRGYHVFIIQTGGNYDNRSINDHLVELLTLINACKLASAKTISVIMPSFAYARSDKKDVPRVPIMGSCFVNILISMGVNRIISMDLHAGQIQGFSSEPFDNLYGSVLFLPFIEDNLFKDMSKEEINNKYILASPDVGGVKRVEAYARKLGMKHVIMHKHRDYDKTNSVLNTILIGDHDVVEGKTAIIIDDIFDSFGTIISSSEELIKHGAKKIIAIATHGIFSGQAMDKINKSDYIEKVIVTNTLPQNQNLEKTDKLCVIDTSYLFATAINLIRTNGSISTLFKH